MLCVVISRLQLLEGVRVARGLTALDCIWIGSYTFDLCDHEIVNPCKHSGHPSNQKIEAVWNSLQERHNHQPHVLCGRRHTRRCMQGRFRRSFYFVEVYCLWLDFMRRYSQHQSAATVAQLLHCWSSRLVGMVRFMLAVLSYWRAKGSNHRREAAAKSLYAAVSIDALWQAPICEKPRDSHNSTGVLN